MRTADFATISVRRLCVAAFLLSLGVPAVTAQEAVVDAFTEYTDFTPYDAGIILPAQITDDLFDNFVFIDTRSAEEFAYATIEGAIHSKWRLEGTRISA